MFKVKDIEKIDETVKEVKELDFSKSKINNINYGEDIVQQLIVVFNTIEKVCLVAVLALVLVTAFLITNTIKLAIYSRKREIEIMRLVGASNISIKVPFIIEGLFIGILGSVLPVVLIIVGYTSLYDFFGGELFGSALATLVNPIPFVYYVSIILVGIGIVVGMRKPDPELFAMGCRALGMEAGEVLVIGDSYRKDIYPSTTLGCSTVWLKNVCWEEENVEPGHEPTAIITSLEQLAGAVPEIV